jgi:hypothetical protein
MMNMWAAVRFLAAAMLRLAKWLSAPGAGPKMMSA